MASQEDADINDEVLQIYAQFGLQGLENWLTSFKKTEVNIAVTGQSGSGKSSFINRLRGLTPKEKDNPLYAKPGVTETTTKPQSYAFPENCLITLWDLPGAGTKHFPIKTYAEDMKFAKYDAFIILTKDRFFENDSLLSQMIKAQSKPFYFARTHTDAAMRAESEDMGEDFCPKKTEDDIKNNCKAELNDATTEIFLLSKKDPITVEIGEEKMEINFPDNERLKLRIINSIESIQRTALGKVLLQNYLLISREIGIKEKCCC